MAAPTTPGAPDKTQGLDEVLMAMDVVDTLRHREQIFLREIDRKGREDELVARLKDIYAAQGMDVPETVIREGVRAMADDRFSHTPARPGLMRRLAIIYITRARWWKPVVGVLALIALVLGGWQFGVVMPREARAEAARIEITETLPAELRSAAEAARNAATTPGGEARAAALFREGQMAAAAGDRDGARQALTGLRQLKSDLETVYTVRIVSRPGEFSGVFRIPDDVPEARNYYLIVEAVDAVGNILEVPVTSEETQTVHRVSRWGQRVSRDVFDRVAADKADDQIIQNAIVGNKPAGALYPTYTVTTPGGAIVEW